MEKLPSAGLLGLVLLAAGPSCFAADSATAERLPPAAEAIVSKMDTEIVAAKQRTVSALEKLMRETTKKGDLEGAVAIKQEIERLEAEIKAGRRPQVGSFVGKWRVADGNTTFEVFPDGRLVNSSGIKGRWIARGALVDVEWENGVQATLQPANGGWVGQRKSANGVMAQVNYVRVSGP